MANYVIDIKTDYEVNGPRVGKGWVDLVKPIEEYIERYNASVDERNHIQILSVSKKQDRLSIVTNGITDELQCLINTAVDLSTRTNETE